MRSLTHIQPSWLVKPVTWNVTTEGGQTFLARPSEAQVTVSTLLSYITVVPGALGPHGDSS